MAMDEEQPAQPESEASPTRRSFISISTLSTASIMTGGVVGGYGLLAIYSGKYLYPVYAGRTVWQFVCTLEQLAVGESTDFTLPSGAKVVVARQTEGVEADAFVALSSVCPHLGCQVHWEAVKSRFFCPCHNGAFDASGQPTEGPPEKANQPLTRFPLRVEGNLLMIETPVGAVEVPRQEAGE